MRNAPVKVVVFQCPCGIGDRQRVPRFDRPRSRAIFVEVPVSSIKTSLSGSRSGWPLNQARRRASTSGRSCSLACAVFFQGHRVTVEKTPDRARCELRSMFRPQHLGQLDKGDVDLALDRRQNHVAIRFNPLGALVATLRLCPCRTALPPFTDPAHGTCDRDTKSIGSCSPRQTCFNSRDHPRP